MLRVLTTVTVLALVAGTNYAGETKIGLTGTNTKVTFVGTKPGGKHDGGFKKVTGSASVNGTDLTTLKVNVEIDMTSLYSDNAKLTSHLKTNDFFDVANHPKGTFVSTKVEKSGEGYTVAGKLTLCGKTKDVSFPAKIAVKDGNLDLSSTFKINRHDWGISYGKGKVDDEVTVSVAVTK